MPVIIRWVIDALNNDTLTTEMLWKYLGGFILIGVISVYFSRLLRAIPLKISHKIEYALRRDLFQHLTVMDQDFYRTQRTGDLMTRLSSDINIIRDSIGQGLLQGSRTLVVISLSSVVMFLTQPTLAIMVISLFTPMVLIFFFILRVMRKHQQALQEHVSEVSNFCQETFSGIRCLKGFALENRRNQQFSDLNSDLIDKTMRMQSTRQMLFPFMAFWFGLGIILITLEGGKKIIHGEMSIGTMTQFLQYVLYMQWPLLALSWVLSMLQRGKVSWDRVKEILDRRPLVENEDTVTRADNDEISGNIQFRNLNLSFNNKRYLSDINLDIGCGETIGITGPTGSGKTLLTSLVPRLMDPTDGAVLIGGKNIRHFSIEKLRSIIGHAAQEPILFSRSLAQNIGFGIDEADMDSIRWAANIAHLGDDIESFTDKYDTILGERGVTLSGGQRQRTSISRAIARRPEILILDDVLSAVDTQTEAAIMSKLQPVMKERTTLFVSHRISTLRYADKIIVLEEGKITQQGTHEQLIMEEGYYQELNTMQQLEEQLKEDAS